MVSPLIFQTFGGFWNGSTKILTRCNNCFAKYCRFSTTTAANIKISSRGRPVISQADALTDIGTRDLFTEEHDIYRATLRKFFREEMKPHYDRWDKQKYIEKEYWMKMGEAGVFGASVPSEYGGPGADYRMNVVATEEQVYSMIEAAVCFHGDVITNYIVKNGTDEQKQKYLSDMVAGKTIGALAMTEPDAGSDVQNMKTYAEQDGDDWIINGSKVFISFGYICDVVIVAAVTDLETETKSQGITLFMVDNGTPGFSKGRILQKLGAHYQDTAELFFEDVRVPSSAILGGPTKLNKGFYTLMQELPLERILFSIWSQALSEIAFEETRNYIKQRKAFGRTLSKLQTIQHRMAEMKTKICVSRAFVDQTIQLYLDDKLDTATAGIAKLMTTDIAMDVTNECLQLHGGWGYMWEYPIARLYTVARMGPIVGGSNEIQKEIIARTI